MSDAKPQRPVPQPTPETQHFWDGCNDGKIILQRCKDTGKAYFPPRPFSPYTGSRNVETFEASGKGVLWSTSSAPAEPELRHGGAIRHRRRQAR